MVCAQVVCVGNFRNLSLKGAEAVRHFPPLQMYDETAPCFSFRAKAEKKVLASRIASCMPQLIWFGAGEVPLARKPVFAVRVQRTTRARVSSVCSALLRRHHFALCVQQAVLLRNGTF